MVLLCKIRQPGFCQVGEGDGDSPGFLMDGGQAHDQTVVIFCNLHGSYSGVVYLHQGICQGQSALVSAIGSIGKIPVGKAAAHFLQLRQIAAGGCDADTEMTVTDLGIGIGTGGAAQQRNFHPVVIAPVTVFAVGHESQTGAGCVEEVAAAAVVVGQGRALDEADLAVTEEVFGSSAQPGAEGQLGTTVSVGCHAPVCHDLQLQNRAVRIQLGGDMNHVVLILKIILKLLPQRVLLHGSLNQWGTCLVQVGFVHVDTFYPGAAALGNSVLTEKQESSALAGKQLLAAYLVIIAGDGQICVAEGDLHQIVFQHQGEVVIYTGSQRYSYRLRFRI